MIRGYTEWKSSNWLLRTRRLDSRALRSGSRDFTFRIVIEARDEEDARCLCTEMGWELICCCEG
jgi:hypothetical protein